MFVFFVVLPTTPFVKALVRWATGKRLTNHLPKLSLITLLITCVHRRWSIERHQKSMDFGREGGCGGPYLAVPPTSARVQNRAEFVGLARDMS